MQLKLLFLLLVSVCFTHFLIAQTSTKDSIDIERIVFEKAEVNAEYPGGLKAWQSFLIENLNAGVAVDNGAPAGYYTVYVRFIVSREGVVSDVKPLTNLGYGMEQEVVRILKKAGNWSPGMQNNRFVNSYHTQPVTFVVENEGLDITTKVPHKLFTGIDNEINITASKLKPEDQNVTITNGRITPLKDGNYIVKVSDTTRRAVITVYNAKKKDKEIGAESFEVRPRREAPDAKKD